MLDENLLSAEGIPQKPRLSGKSTSSTISPAPPFGGIGTSSLPTRKPGSSGQSTSSTPKFCGKSNAGPINPTPLIPLTTSTSHSAVITPIPPGDQQASSAVDYNPAMSSNQMEDYYRRQLQKHQEMVMHYQEKERIRVEKEQEEFEKRKQEFE